MRAPDHRVTLDALRAELQQLWSAPVFDVDEIAIVNREIQAMLKVMKAEREKQPLPLWPDADTVAVAIVAAAKELRTDPIASAEGVKGSKDYLFSRCRSYSAAALRAVFNDPDTPGAPGSAAFCRMVGGDGNTLGVVDYQVRHNKISWWSDELFMRVVGAIEKHVAA